MRKYILLLILLFPIVYGLKGQIVNSKNFLSFSAGKVLFGGPDDLFFPKGFNNGSLSLRADYLHTILPWIKIGVEGSLIFPGVEGQGSNAFATISSKNEKMMTGGLNATFFLPYKDTGWRNRF